MNPNPRGSRGCGSVVEKRLMIPNPRGSRRPWQQEQAVAISISSDDEGGTKKARHESGARDDGTTLEHGTVVKNGTALEHGTVVESGTALEHGTVVEKVRHESGARGAAHEHGTVVKNGTALEHCTVVEKVRRESAAREPTLYGQLGAGGDRGRASTARVDHLLFMANLEQDELARRHIEAERAADELARRHIEAEHLRNYEYLLAVRDRLVKRRTDEFDPILDPYRLADIRCWDELLAEAKQKLEKPLEAVAKHLLQNYCFTMRNTLQESQDRERDVAKSNAKMEKAIWSTLDWLHENQLAKKDEIEARHKELEAFIDVEMDARGYA